MYVKTIIQMKDTTMGFKYASTQPNINLDDIHRYEESEGIKLPVEYKQFLLTSNGGQLEKGQILRYVDHNSNERILSPYLVYGVAPPNSVGLDVLKTNKERPSSEYLPSHLLEIVICDDGHKRLVLSTRKDDYGQVYVWDNQSPFDYDETSVVAESIGELLSKVEIEDPQEGINRLKELLKKRQQDEK